MHELEQEILGLLRDGPATLGALETATGRPAGEVWRALTRLFATGQVWPHEGDVWRTLAPTAVAP